MSILIDDAKLRELQTEAGLATSAEGARMFHYNNWKGAGWEIQQGRNPEQLQFVEAWGVFPFLPGGSCADPELCRLRDVMDTTGFKERVKSLVDDAKNNPSLRPPGHWGETLKTQWTAQTTEGRARQLAYMFVDARRGDVVVMQSSGKMGDPSSKETHFKLGVFVTDPEGVLWMEPEQIGAVRAGHGSHGDTGMSKSDTGFVKVNERWVKVLAGPLAVRPVRWLKEGLRRDLPRAVQSSLSGLQAPTAAKWSKDVATCFSGFLKASDPATRSRVVGGASAVEPSTHGKNARPKRARGPTAAEGSDAGFSSRTANGQATRRRTTLAEASYSDSAQTFFVGQRVRARYQATARGSTRGTFMYGGTLVRSHANGTWDVSYDDGDFEDSVLPCYLEAFDRSFDGQRELIPSAVRNELSEEETSVAEAMQAAVEAAPAEAVTAEVVAVEAAAVQAAAAEAAMEAAAAEAAVEAAAAEEVAVEGAAAEAAAAEAAATDAAAVDAAVAEQASGVDEAAVAEAAAVADAAAPSFPVPVPLAQSKQFSTGRTVDESTVGGGMTCNICFTGPKTHAAIPCGHLFACSQCATDLERQKKPCPMCRAEVNQFIMIHMC